MRRFALLYRAHAALRAAMTQAPGTGNETRSGSGERQQALARCHRAFGGIDAARILQATMAGQLHPAAATVIATLNSEREGLARHRGLPQPDRDSNPAGRALRAPVIGRRNFYGSGAAWAADLAAGIWTITATAARDGTGPLHLLTGYLTAWTLLLNSATRRAMSWMPDVMAIMIVCCGRRLALSPFPAAESGHHVDC
jgi:hypothetical protein